MRTGADDLRLGAAVLAALALAACGGQFNPTSPDLSGATPGPSAGAAVVSGQVTVSGQRSSDLQGIRVTVDGTSISDRTDRHGHFELPSVPAGSPGLRFRREGMDLRLKLEDVPADRHVRIEVSLGPDAANLAALDSEPLVEFEDVVVSTSAGAATLTLLGGTLVVVSETTWWDSGGSLFSFAEIEAALADGLEVQVEGQGAEQDDGSVLATAVRAEADDALSDDDGGDGDTDDGTVDDDGGGDDDTDDGTVGDDDDDGDDTDDGGTAIDFTGEIGALDVLIDQTAAAAMAAELGQTENDELMSPLEAARASLERGDGHSAKGQLDTYQDDLEALVRSDRLAEEIADDLDDAAEAIIDAVESKLEGDSD